MKTDVLISESAPLGRICDKDDFIGVFPACLRRGDVGFSLVEVTIAVAILSLCLLSLIGLLSIGLTQNRQNIDRSIETQIMDWVHAEAQKEYEGGNLAGLSGRVEQFDNLGLATTPGNASAIYAATITTSQVNTLPGSTKPLWTVTAVISSPARANQVLSTNSFWLSTNSP